MIQLSLTRGRVALRLTAERLGADLAVTLSGGHRAHIGAVAVGQPRLDEGATTSVLAVVGHREDELARVIATRLAAATRGVVCVACGIHVDRIRPEEIDDIRRMSDALTERLLQRLAPGAGAPRRRRQRASSSHQRRSQAPKRRKPRRSTA